MHISLVALVSRENEKEIEMEHWSGWYGFPESMEREMFGGGPRNDHDLLRLKALSNEDRARTNARACELYVRKPNGELPSIPFCWRTALNEVFAAKGVVMKLKRRPRGLCDPLLVPSPGATKVCETCGQPVAKTPAAV